MAFGTVLTEPETRADDDDPFWLDSERSRRPERRVLVRYELAQRLPLWADAPGNEALQGLSVARSRGRSVFRVTGEQWSGIASLAELATERDSDGGGWRPARQIRGGCWRTRGSAERMQAG